MAWRSQFIEKSFYWKLLINLKIPITGPIWFELQLQIKKIQQPPVEMEFTNSSSAMNSHIFHQSSKTHWVINLLFRPTFIRSKNFLTQTVKHKKLTKHSWTIVLTNSGWERNDSTKNPFDSQFLVKNDKNTLFS